jgi:hypothetical protein
MLVGAYDTIAEGEAARLDAILEIEESDKILARIGG